MEVDKSLCSFVSPFPSKRAHRIQRCKVRWSWTCGGHACWQQHSAQPCAALSVLHTADNVLRDDGGVLKRSAICPLTGAHRAFHKHNLSLYSPRRGGYYGPCCVSSWGVAAWAPAIISGHTHIIITVIHQERRLSPLVNKLKFIGSRDKRRNSKRTICQNN